jgi:heat shock protein HslJ
LSAEYNKINHIEMKTIAIIPFFAAMFILFISGCSGSSGNEGGTKIYGNEWKLESLNGKSIQLKGGKNITIIFNRANGNFKGFSGCNTSFGIYFSGKKNLQLSEISQTEMVCDEMKTESDYMEALKKVDGYKISEDKLNLTSFGNPVAVFKK